MPRGRRSKKKEENRILNIQVAILLVASVLLTILIYTKSGYIGETLSPILGGIMGWIKFVIPFGVFAIAVFMAKEEEKEDFFKKILQYAIFMVCITTVITVIQAYRGNISIEGNFEECVKNAYYEGTRNQGGGAAGCVCAFILVKLLRKIRSDNCINRNSSYRLNIPIWSKTCRTFTRIYREEKRKKRRI